jgi:hypothetical protein
MFRRFPEWIDAAAVIVFSALVATRQEDQLKWFWGYPPVAHATWLPLGMTTAAAFFGAFQPVSSIRDQKQKPVRSVWDRHLLYTLGELIERCQQIAEESKTQASSTKPALMFDFGDLGLHVWKVAWHRRSEWPFYGRELERVKTVRLGLLPALRQISFYKGKGVVGKCWKLNDEVIVDNDSRYRHVQSETDWLSLNPADRDGFSYQEFIRVRDRGAILASPVRDQRQRFIGCISIDVKTGAKFVHDNLVRGKIQQLCTGLSGSYFEGLE